MITILFVDDERGLAELRRVTQPWRHVWDVHFAASPGPALALVDELPRVDVIVSDMVVDGDDATELLGSVRDRSPHTARLVLSGRADRDALFRAVGAAHQYLSKPVDIEELAAVVEHVRGASVERLRDPVFALIGQADRLPSPPAIFQQLITMVDSEDWTVDDVAELLSSDVALTAELLKLVNSSYFGFFGDVSSVERAVTLLGVDLIRSVVLGSKLFLPDDAIESWLDLERLDARCAAVANGARCLALRDGASSTTAAAAHLTGMVSEIGLLVMARVTGIDPALVASLDVAPAPEIERAVFGGDRFQVGCQLLRLWGFSTPIVEAIEGLGRPADVPTEGLSWYVAAARRLVLDERIDPLLLATPAGTLAELDAAVDRVRHGFHAVGGVAHSVPSR